MEDVALFFHLFGAFSLIGGTIVAGVAFETARRRVAPAEIALLLGVTRIGVVLVALGAVMVLGFGLWLVDLGDWSYGAGWVDAALGLFAAAVVMGGIGGQRPKRARKLAQRLAAERTSASGAPLPDRRVTRRAFALGRPPRRTSTSTPTAAWSQSESATVTMSFPPRRLTMARPT